MNHNLLPSKYPLPKNSPIVYHAKELISKAWGFNGVIHHNPAPNPISLERKHMSHLKKHIADYVVAEKSDGIRYLLVMGNFQKKAYAVMVNRRMQMFEVPLYANPDYFEDGSVFDGELVIETTPHLKQERQVYLVFDVCLIKGEICTNYPFLDRYQRINQAFDIHKKDILNDEILKWEGIALSEAQENDKIVSLGNFMALTFRPKPAVPMTNLGSLWRSVDRLNHPSDGFILTPTPTPILTGTHETMFKWKHVHTLDLILEAYFKNGKWSYFLFFNDGPDKVEGETLNLKVSETPLLTQTSKYFGDNNQTRYKLLGEFKCQFDGTNVWCILERWRRDKSTPNNKKTIERTLVNVRENITIAELLDLTSLQVYGL